MSGYVPVFGSIFQGTLCGRWPDTGVWLCLLALADKNGHIDMTVPYISAVTGIPVDVLTDCIGRFTSPDPHSRTKSDDGRRLSRLDPNRDWGWHVINHGLYREKARKQMQQIHATESGRDAERKRIAREKKSGDVQPRPAISSADRLSDADADTDIRVRGAGRATRSPRSRKVPEGFSPDLAFAESVIPDIDASAEAAKFRDWEFKTPRTDWPAAWRNWIRTCQETGKYARRGGKQVWQ